MIYILNSHDDNDIYFKAVWEKETITNMMKREQYANITRRILEQYDRVALGNNIISLENLESRVS
jgi:predicted alternative tryptophan synthase beta-subunit